VQFIEAPKTLHSTVISMSTILVLHIIMAILSWSFLSLSNISRKITLISSLGWVIFSLWGIYNLFSIGVTTQNSLFGIPSNNLLIIHIGRVIVYGGSVVLLYKCYKSANKQVKLVR